MFTLKFPIVYVALVIGLSCASHAMGGVFKSNDGGKSWTDITGKAALNRYTRIVIDPFNQRKIYLGTYGVGAFVRTDQD